MNTEREILNKIVKGNSPWLEKAKFRRMNEAWLDDSAKIALVILKHLKKNNISQARLAELIEVQPQQVSKIVKGQENLTLKTIKKIENALDIKLIDVIADFLTDKNIDASTKFENIFYIDDYSDINDNNFRPTGT